MIPRKVAAMAADLEELGYLLRALCPSIEELLPLFERSGVCDSSALRTVAEFPIQVQSVFLREDMGLNAFQYRKVSLALQSLIGVSVS